MADQRQDFYTAVAWGFKYAQALPGVLLYEVSKKVPLGAAFISPQAAALKFGTGYLAGLFPAVPDPNELPPQYLYALKALQYAGHLQAGFSLFDQLNHQLDKVIDRVKGEALRRAKVLLEGLLDDGEKSGVVVYVVPVWKSDP